MSIWLKENQPGKVQRGVMHLPKELLMEMHHQTPVMSLAHLHELTLTLGG